LNIITGRHIKAISKPIVDVVKEYARTPLAKNI
jgi:hypothetical protein